MNLAERSAEADRQNHIMDAIRFENVSKSYPIYDSPGDRLCIHAMIRASWRPNGMGHEDWLRMFVIMANGCGTRP